MMRRLLAAATAAFLAVAPFGAPAQAADKTLKVVVHADLKVLDPVWTTGTITQNEPRHQFISANMPPTRNIMKVKTTYWTPITLWSVLNLK